MSVSAVAIDMSVIYACVCARVCIYVRQFLAAVQSQSVLGDVAPLPPWSVPESRVTILLGCVWVVEMDIWGRGDSCFS